MEEKIFYNFEKIIVMIIQYPSQEVRLVTQENHTTEFEWHLEEYPIEDKQNATIWVYGQININRQSKTAFFPYGICQKQYSNSL